MGLEGCLKQFDSLAKQFVTADAVAQKRILASMTEKVNELKADKHEHSTATKYLKIAEKIQENGMDFVKTEQGRLRKLTDGNVSDNKKIEIKLRLNILQSFAQQPGDGKLEL